MKKNKGFDDLDLKPASKWGDESDVRLKQISRPRYSHLIAIRILRTLRDKNLKQKDLADALEVSPQTVNKWVKGSENFTLDTIERIELALGVKLVQVCLSADISILKLSKTLVNATEIDNIEGSLAVSFTKKETKVIPLNAGYLSDINVPKLNYSNS